MKINKKIKASTANRTANGAPAYRLDDVRALRRSVMSCLLWEKEFYEDGETIANRIYSLALKVPPRVLAELAIETRTVANLRHAPLALLSALVKTGSGTSLPSETIAITLQRADELTEFLAVHAKLNGVDNSKIKSVLSAQAKKGLAKAFTKFNAYNLAKYDRAGEIRLRDVLFLTHAKPKDADQAEVWDQLINGTLAAPDTWEVGLSAGEDKKQTFTRLLKDKKLGYLALLRNLRNMSEAGVDRKLIRKALANDVAAKRVLPFRYVAAMRACPELESSINKALLRSIKKMKKLKGLTVVLVDHSGSMTNRLSARSDMTRFDAAATLAAIVPGQDIRTFSFTTNCVEVPTRKGMAGITAISNAQGWGCTNLGLAIRHVAEKVPGMDRLIVITDEQSGDVVGAPPCDKAYMINVASNRNGVGYGKWTHIDGFSENVIKFIREFENTDK